MKNALATLLCGVFALTAAHAAEDVKVMGGPDGFTTQVFATDLADLARACGYSAKAQISDGSLENLLSLQSSEPASLSFLQTDVLEYLRAYETEDPEIAKAIDGVEIAFPLYQQEVHIVARKDIGSLAELEGARVSIGAPNSGDFLTTTVMFDLLGYGPAERLTLSPQRALDALQKGSIDAMIFVDGAPSALLANSDLDAASFHLIDIVDPILEIAYRSSQIDAGTYAFSPETTKVVSMQSVVVTYDFAKSLPAEEAARKCDQVADISFLTMRRLDKFQSEGHVKWQGVTLSEDVPDWSRSECSARGLSPEYQLTCP